MADKAFYSLLVDLTANVAKLQTDMDKAVGVLRRATSVMGGVWRGFTEEFGREFNRVAVEGVKHLATALTDLADKGEAAGSIADAFKKLGGSSGAIEDARKATLGMVSSFDLMKEANAALARGMPNVNKNFATLADFASRFADATGREMLPVLDQLIQGIGSGAPKALREFGVYLDGSRTLTQRWDDAVKQISVRMQAFEQDTDSVSNAHKAFKTSLDDALKSVGIGINNNATLTQVYRLLAEEVRKIDWQAVGEAIAKMAAVVVQYAIPAIQGLSQVVIDVGRGFDAIFGKSAQAQLDRVASRMGELKTQIANLEQLPSATTDVGPLGRLMGMKTASETLAAAKREMAILQDEWKRISNDMLRGNQPGAPFPLPKPTGGSLLPPEVINGTKNAAKKATKEIADDWGDKMAKEAQKQAEKMQKAQEEAYKQSIDTWQSLFDAAINGTTFNLESALRQVAVGFAAQMAQALFGNIGGLGSLTPQGIGGMLAQGIFGGGGGGGGSILAGMGGGAGLGSWLFGGGRPEGVAGPLMENGQFTPGVLSSVAPQLAIAAAIYTIGAKLGGNKYGGLFGAIPGRILGAFGIGEGPTNPDTLGRKKVEGFLEDKFGTNFVFGSSKRFNDGKGWEFFDTLDAQTKKTFSGLGEALRQTLDITEDIGPQIGAILSENLSGSADKARHMFKRLGFSIEDLEARIVEVGLQGKKTWLEIEGILQGIHEAAKPGLQAMGDYAGAFQNLIASGGRGFEAVQSLRDIAIEAREAGVKNFDELRVVLLKTFDPKLVEEFFQALKQRGITTMDQLQNVTDRTGGGIVADMTALGFAFQEASSAVQEATKAVQDYADATRGIAGKSSTSDDVEAFAKGGIVTRPTRSLLGEAGPEAILPLTRKNGRLGVSVHGLAGGMGGGMVVHIDARGAAPGVEHQIRAAMNRAVERAVRQSVRAVSRREGRGGEL